MRLGCLMADSLEHHPTQPIIPSTCSTSTSQSTSTPCNGDNILQRQRPQRIFMSTFYSDCNYGKVITRRSNLTGITYARMNHACMNHAPTNYAPTNYALTNHVRNLHTQPRFMSYVCRCVYEVGSLCANLALYLHSDYVCKTP
jgi:hypothetical protein